jgi:DNA polymerase III epsilon subunit-like protein
MSALQAAERPREQPIPPLLRDTSFAVVDVETTGFSPLNGDRVVEIAVVRLWADVTRE